MKKIVSFLKREFFIGYLLLVLISLIMLLTVNFLNKYLDLIFLQKLFSRILILLIFLFMLTYINKNIIITTRNDFGFGEKASNIVSCVVPFFFWRSFCEWFILVLNNNNVISPNINYEDIFWVPAILSAVLLFISKENLSRGLKEYTKYLETLTELETIGMQKLYFEQFFFTEVIKIEDFDRSTQDEWKNFFTEIYRNQVKNISLTRKLIENIKQFQLLNYEINEKFIKDEIRKIESVSFGGYFALDKIFIRSNSRVDKEREMIIKGAYPDLTLIEISNALKNELGKLRESKKDNKIFTYFKSIIHDPESSCIIDFENINPNLYRFFDWEM